MGGACGTHGSEEKCVRDLMQKLEGKDRYLKPICRWDNIKMDLKNIGREDVDWIDVNEDKDKWQSLVDTDMNLRVPQNAGNCLISWRTKFFKDSAWWNYLSVGAWWDENITQALLNCPRGNWARNPSVQANTVTLWTPKHFRVLIYSTGIHLIKVRADYRLRLQIGPV